MTRSSSLLLLMLCVLGWFSTAASVDCAESVPGALTLLSQREDNAPTDVSQVDLASTTTRGTGQSFAGDDLTVNFVSNLQHLRTVVNSDYTASLLDGAVIVVFKNSTVVHLPLDADYCIPYQLFQHSPNNSAFVMCSNRSRVMELELTPAGFLLETTPIQAQEGQKYLGVPAVPLYHPDYQASAAFIHFGFTSNEEYNKTWLTLVPNIDTGVNSHTLSICDDTYDEGREICDTEFASIVAFNETRFVLECRETSDSDAVRFLVDAFSEDGCDGIVALDVPSGGELYVGPDRNTLVVNLGDSVSVHTNDFTLSYHCVVTEGPIVRVDFGITASNGVLLLLFTSESIFTCDSFGGVKLLSSSPLLDGPYPYLIDNKRIFVTQEGYSADFYQITLFDTQEGCEVQYPNDGHVYTDKRPVLYLFSPKAHDPTATLLPTQPTVDQVTTTVVTPSSSLTDASTDTVAIVVPILAGVILVLLILLLILSIIAVLCNKKNRRKSFRISVKVLKRPPSVSISDSSAVSDPPIAETQTPSPAVHPVPETDSSPFAMRHPIPETGPVQPAMKLPIPETEEPDMRPPIQAVADALRMKQTQAQLV